jgi:hypothetical protein
LSEPLYPHLQRREFVRALAVYGPKNLPRRRFLMVLTAMADQWSLIQPDVPALALAFNVRSELVREWLAEFEEDRWLSATSQPGLSLVHLPENSAAFRDSERLFEWRKRFSAPVVSFPARPPAATTACQVPDPDGSTPLTARAPIQLPLERVFEHYKGQFAYISFVQESLSVQPVQEHNYDPSWNRFLDQL